MRYLAKPPQLLEAHQGLRYSNERDKEQARALLKAAQHGCCAYTEKWLAPLESVDLEHFDPTLKHTDQDSISNWHAVLHSQNLTKPRKMEPKDGQSFLPMADPQAANTWDRITYRDHEFVEKVPGDLECLNLIRWVNANREHAVKERKEAVKRIKDMVLTLGEEETKQLVQSHGDFLSFPTAIESELGWHASEWLRALTQPSEGAPT